MPLESLRGVGRHGIRDVPIGDEVRPCESGAQGTDVFSHRVVCVVVQANVESEKTRHMLEEGRKCIWGEIGDDEMEGRDVLERDGLRKVGEEWGPVHLHSERIIRDHLKVSSQEYATRGLSVYNEIDGAPARKYVEMCSGACSGFGEAATNEFSESLSGYSRSVDVVKTRIQMGWKGKVGEERNHVGAVAGTKRQEPKGGQRDSIRSWRSGYEVGHLAMDLPQCKELEARGAGEDRCDVVAGEVGSATAQL